MANGQTRPECPAWSIRSYPGTVASSPTPSGRTTKEERKALFDITADTKPGMVSKGLEQIARLLNLYGAAGMKLAT